MHGTGARARRLGNVLLAATAMLAATGATAKIVDAPLQIPIAINRPTEVMGIWIYSYFQTAVDVDPSGLPHFASGVRVGSATPSSFSSWIADDPVDAFTSVGPSTAFIPYRHPVTGGQATADLVQHYPWQMNWDEPAIQWNERLLPSGVELLFPAVFAIGDGSQFPAEVPRYYGVLRMAITDYGRNAPFSVAVIGASYEDSGGIYSPVPEPETLWMWTAGSLSAGVAAWRRRRARGAQLGARGIAFATGPSQRP